jgi:copper chaperone NosL
VPAGLPPIGRTEISKTRKEIAMKKILYSTLIVLCLLGGTVLWALDNDVKDIPACKYCGMNREMFAHSRMHIEYGDGSKVGLCSLHCAAVDLALNLDKTPSSIRVGDYDKKQLIDAEKATWVIGGNRPGVMTKNAKWAFADKSDAEKFQQANGGRIATFDEALQASYQDLGNDTKMIREKRKMMKSKMMQK